MSPLPLSPHVRLILYLITPLKPFHPSPSIYQSPFTGKERVTLAA